jgi:AcrR family transcriptional regulator
MNTVQLFNGVSMTDLTPSERRHERTREAILEAAGELLRQHGLDGLSIRALAEAVDYSPAALYQYFENKEAILNALGEQGFAYIDRIMTRHLEKSQIPAEGIRGFALGLLEFARTYPHFFLVMFADESVERRGMADVRDNPQFNILVDLFRKGIQDEGFTLPEGYTPFEAAFHLWMTLHGISLIRLKFIRDPELEFDPLAARIMANEINYLTGKG